MNKSQITLSDDSRNVYLGHKHLHTLHLNRVATKAEIIKALRDVPNINSTTPASMVAKHAKAALVAAWLM